MLHQSPYTAVFLIPTGIGASIGGFAGDALPLARILSSLVDCLVTHPNVLNGATLFWPISNALYVEGYGLDQFCRGSWNLRPVRQNRVGVILDAGLELDLYQRHIHAIQAAQATLGLQVDLVISTEYPLGVQVSYSPSGASQGKIDHPNSLLKAAQELRNQGAEAIALVAQFPPDLDFSDYEQGRGVDPLAGVEAVLSHLLVREYQIPCAHAPALHLPTKPQPIHPRAAAEEVGFTFLPSVLAGLSYAPQFVVNPSQMRYGDITVADVKVVIAPATAFGSPSILHLARQNPQPLFIAVEENKTVMRVHPRDLGIAALQAKSYLEAIGFVAAHRAGVFLA
jgi:hypothetical protein